MRASQGIIALLIFGASTATFAGASSTYVMVAVRVVPAAADAGVDAPAQVPRWLAVWDLRRGTLLHLRLDLPIVKLKPSTYLLFHVDFSEDSRSGANTIFLDRAPPRVIVHKGAVNFIGTLTLEPTTRKREVGMPVVRRFANVTYDDEGSILIEACRTQKAILDEHNLLIPVPGKEPRELKIRCAGE